MRKSDGMFDGHLPDPPDPPEDEGNEFGFDFVFEPDEGNEMEFTPDPELLTQIEAERGIREMYAHLWKNRS